MSMEQVININVPEVNDMTYGGFDEVVYSNGAKHVYGIDESGKKHHVSHMSVAESYGLQLRSSYMPDVIDGQDNPNRPVYTGYATTREAAIVAAEPVASVVAQANVIAKPNKAEAAVLVAAKIAPAVGSLAVGKRSWKDKIHQAVDSTKAAMHRAGEAIRSAGDHTKSSAEIARAKTMRKVGAVAFAGFAVLGISRVAYGGEPAANSLGSVAAANAPISTDLSVAHLTAKVASAAEAPATTAVSAEQAQLNDAITNKLSEIGLKPGQYQVVSANETLPGSIEANQYSMDHGSAAWANTNSPRNLNGAKHLSEDILNAKAGFSASDATVAKQTLERFGAPNSVITQLAAGNYTNLGFEMYTLNGTEAVYHQMSWNDNGIAAVEANRTVNPLNQDAIAILSFKGANGNVQAISFRVDCGGANIQAFGSITVTTPEAQTPVTVPETTPPTKSTTTPKPAPKPAPTTTTTFPKSITTTTTQFIGPKQDSHPPVTSESTPTTVGADPLTGPTPTTYNNPPTTFSITGTGSGSTPNTYTTPTTIQAVTAPGSTPTTAPGGTYNNLGNN